MKSTKRCIACGRVRKAGHEAKAGTTRSYSFGCEPLIRTTTKAVTIINRRIQRTAKSAGLGFLLS